MKAIIKEGLLFWYIVGRKFLENELFYMANALTYRMIMAFFPFLVVLLSLFGLINLNSSVVFATMLENMLKPLPAVFVNLVHNFISNAAISGTLFSVSLLYGIWSSTLGFHSIINGMNRCTETKETRGFVTLWLLSFVLVFIFIAYIVLCLIFVIFDDRLISFMMGFPVLVPVAMTLKSLPLNIFAFLLTGALVIIFYKFTAARRFKLKMLLPGAIFTIAAWIILSVAFSIYTKLNTNAFILYGSIAGIFITIYWVNLLAMTLLCGAQINGVLMSYKRYRKYYVFHIKQDLRRARGKLNEKKKD